MNEFTSSCNIQMPTKNVMKHILNKAVANLPLVIYANMSANLTNSG